MVAQCVSPRNRGQTTFSGQSVEELTTYGDTIKNAIKDQGTEAAKKAVLKAIPGFEDRHSLTSKTYLKLNETIFRGINAVLDKNSEKGSNRTVRLFGELMLTLGDYGEHVNRISAELMPGLIADKGISAGKTHTLQNRMGQGLDFAFRWGIGDWQGQWGVFESKSGARGWAGRLKGKQKDGAAKYGTMQLREMALGEGRYASGTAAPRELKAVAKTILEEQRETRQPFRGFVFFNNHLFSDDYKPNMVMVDWVQDARQSKDIKQVPRR